jgi:acyl-CoA synthetase (AMP-forming)/AMP-acid ligase II
VSPVEIEGVLLAHPQRLIADVTVAGVSGGRTSDEKVPHAWIVLADNGRRLGPRNVIMELDKWHKENLSRYKWLRGGIEIVAEVRVRGYPLP